VVVVVVGPDKLVVVVEPNRLVVVVEPKVVVEPDKLVVVVEEGGHAPKFPVAPALLVALGQARAKSFALSPAVDWRVRLRVPLPGPSDVGVPEVGVLLCVDVFLVPE
jgi:hypothetical protein